MIDPTRSDPTRSSHYATGPAGASALTPSSAVAPHAPRPLAALLRLLLAAAAATGIALEITLATDLPRLASYFTIQSNAALAVCATWTAYRTATGRRPVSPRITGAVLLYIVITGLVYHLVLAGDATHSAMTGTAARGTTGTIANHLLHTVTPLVAVLDWLFLTAPRHLRLRHAWQWLAYPLLYLAFALARGALITPGTDGRYPYPFLDVESHGYLAVLLHAVLYGLAFFALALVLLAIDQFRPAPPRPGYRISRSRIGPLK
ncbi:Pr6Pr family membrane protein [Streptomyces niger]|uniref:Pr6Pr family membrane protein n=1 Tax=Streptomyces niger TaxID=66373 RepID=UPI000699F92C|nr:Pr6Pr family membrane protein [Streptomyces niger]